MIHLSTSRVAALFAAAVIVPVIVPSSVARAQGSQPAPATRAELDSLTRRRADSVLHVYSRADVQFMSAMIHHHGQAITMARMAPTHGASPEVQTLAARIINAQQDEIATMQQWLRDRGLPVPDPNAPMDGMGGMQNMSGMHDMHDMHGAGGMAMSHDTTHAALMPGMLTPEQMHQLELARGPGFDRLFLTDMIQHHTGALTMVKELTESYGAMQDDWLFKLVSDINVDQTTEIQRMRRMLVQELFAHPGQQSQ